MRALSWVAPGLAVSSALSLFTFPQRYRAPAREAEVIERSRPLPIPYGGGALAARVWGEGDCTVLLVHGWSGRAGQMGVIGEALARRGLRAVAVELPGHGDSPGRFLNLFQAADAVAAAVRHVGPVEAIVAHSFGVPSAAIAMRTGFPVGRLVAVAPADPTRAIPRFARFTRIGPALHQAMVDQLHRRFGQPLADVGLERLGRGLDLPGLVVHDRTDPIIPFADARRFSAAWGDSTILETEGLGHGRILRDPTVVASIADFITREGRLRCSA